LPLDIEGERTRLCRRSTTGSVCGY